MLVSWNSAADLDRCLRSVLGQSLLPEQIIAVDNGSTDDSVSKLASSGAQVIRNPHNLGFAVAANQGLSQASAELVLLLNADVTLQPDYVEQLAAEFTCDGSLYAATGLLLRHDGTIDSAGHEMYRSRWAINRLAGSPSAAAGERCGVFGVSAAAAMYSLRVLYDLAVDGQVFDPAFFAYLEDVDLDWRAQLRGRHAVFNPAAVGYHRRHGSGAPSKAWGQRQIVKNRLLMLAKHERLASALPDLPLILTFQVGKLLQSGLNHPSSLLGTIDALRLLPGALRQRRRIQATAVRSTLEVRSAMLPGMGPWRKAI